MSEINAERIQRRIREQTFHSVDPETDRATLLFRWENGFEFVKMHLPDGLWCEIKPRNGIGRSLSIGVSGGDRDYFSLRDGNGSPVVTIEARDNRVLDIYGKEGGRPDEQFVVLLQSVLREHIIDGQWATVLGRFLVADGQPVCLDVKREPLPAAETIVGDLDLRHADHDRLPPGLKRLEGDLLVRGSRIETLPDPLEHITGDLIAKDAPLKALPSALLSIGGSLDLRGTSVGFLTEGLEVRGSVDLRRTSITTLPDRLRVSGDVCADKAALTSLGEDIVVGGDLSLSRTSVQSIPWSLRVGGTIRISGTPLASRLGREIIQGRRIPRLARG